MNKENVPNKPCEKTFTSFYKDIERRVTEEVKDYKFILRSNDGYMNYVAFYQLQGTLTKGQGTVEARAILNEFHERS